MKIVKKREKNIRLYMRIPQVCRNSALTFSSTEKIVFFSYTNCVMKTFSVLSHAALQMGKNTAVLNGV